MGYHLYKRPDGAAASSMEEITDIAPAFDEETPLIQMGMGFNNGAATQGEFVIVDPTSDADDSLRMPPHVLVRWTIDALGCEYWLAQGRFSSTETGRIEEGVGGDYVEWDVTVDDCNVDTNGLAFTEDWERPEETDTARLYALQPYTLNGTSSTRPDYGGDITYRPSTEIVVAADHLAPDTHTITMPAKVYPAGTQPYEVINDCMTTAGKVWGVEIHNTTAVVATPIATWDFEDVTPPSTAPDFDNETGTIRLNLLAEDSAANCPYGTTHCAYNTASHRYSDELDVTAGTTYAFTSDIRWKYSPAGRNILVIWSDSMHNPMSTTTLVKGAGHTVGVSYTKTAYAVAPAGAFFAELDFSAFSGIFVDNVVWSSVDSTCDPHLCLEYIQNTDHTTYASTVKISDQLEDWDPDNPTDPVFEPMWLQGKGKRIAYQTAISGLVSRYGTGANIVVSLDSSIGDSYEYWNDSYSDGDSVTATQASNRAAGIVLARNLPEQSNSVSVVMHDYQTPLLACGMSIQVKSAVIAGGVFLGVYQDRRVVELKWEPRADGMWMAHMVLDRGIRRFPPSHGRAQAAATSPKTAADLAFDNTNAGLPGDPDTVQEAIDALAGLATDLWNPPITAPLSIPPTEAELEAAVSAAPVDVQGQVWIVTDSVNGRPYLVTSDGTRMPFAPFVVPTPTGSLPPVGDIIEMEAAPHGGYGDLSHPHGVYASSVNRTYWASLSGTTGNIEAAYYDHATGLPSTPVTVKAAMQKDLHVSPAMLRRPDGYLVVFYSNHNDGGLRYKVSTSADDISSWQAERNIDAQVGGANYTYPMPMQLLDLASDPTFYFIRSDTGASVGHAGQKWAYTRTTGTNLQTATWDAQVVVYRTPSPAGGYFSAHKTSESRVDFSVTSDAPGSATNPIHIGHFYWDGTDYHATDGSVITGLPFDFPDVTEVYHAAAGAHDEWCSPGKVVLGGDGNPRMAFPLLVDDYDIRVMWARWTGAAWDVHEVCGGQWSGAGDPKNRGGIDLDPTDPNIVYVARRVSGQTEIQKFTTADNGATWTETDITTASTSQQTRPFIPTDRASSLKVLWMMGSYVGDTNWNTGTRGSPT